HPEHVLPRALHAEAHPGEPAGAQLLQVGRAHRLRVGLGGHLRPRGEPELAGDRPEDPHQVGRGEQGRRAAAEEHGLDPGRCVAEHAPGQPYLLDHRVRVAGGRGAGAELGGGVGVEVAVPAAGRAERDVDVEPEGARAEPVERARGQLTGGRRRVTVGKHGRHALSLPPPPGYPGQARRPSAGTDQEPSTRAAIRSHFSPSPGTASTRRISSLSPWYAANASPIVTLGHGRSSTSISSPAPSSPVSITRKYAPGRPASVKRLTQPGSPIQFRNTAHGVRGPVTSSTAVPTRHRSPSSAPVTSTPTVVRFSPN